MNLKCFHFDLQAFLSGVSEREQDTFQTWEVEFCYCSFFPPIPFLQKCSSPLPLPFHLSLPTLLFSAPPSWITQEGKAALIDGHWSFPRSEQKVNGWASSIAVTEGGDTASPFEIHRSFFGVKTPPPVYSAPLCFALRSAVYPFQPKAGVWSACPAFHRVGGGPGFSSWTWHQTSHVPVGGIPAVFWAYTCSGCQHSRQEPFCSFSPSYNTFSSKAIWLA